MSILDKLGVKRLYFDGAMGTMLQNSNIELGTLPELVNINYPETVKDIHKQYIAAGANIITTNTFGVNKFKYDNANEVISAAVKIAKEAAAESNDTVYVAFGVGALPKMLKPIGELTFDEAYDAYKHMFSCAKPYNPDLFLIETISDIYEAKIAVLAAKETLDIPIFVTMTFQENGRLLTGADVMTEVSVLESIGATCIGLNCGLGPKQMLPIANEMLTYASLPVIVQPNAGIPQAINGKTVFHVSPDHFAQTMKEMAEIGVSVLGGCCGTTPEHIKAMINVTKNIPLKEITKKDYTFISSSQKTYIVGDTPLIVGERINPTGKKKFKEALENHDLNYILNEAYTQKENGAHILDVNVGIPGIDECQMMYDAITLLQQSIDLPLQIDSASPKVIEHALRIYNGKALINSVNGKDEVLNKILPIVKKYGGVVVGLTLHESGIPETVSGRIEIASKIVDTAKTYGIEKKDIVIDPLSLTVSAQQEQAAKTLKCLSILKEEMCLNTTLGISNISFGLPRRDIINQTFFAQALQNKLSLAIINPSQETMMSTYRAHLVLANIDKNATQFIEQYNDTKVTVNESKKTSHLFDMIIDGVAEKCKIETETLLKIQEPLDIIDNIIVPALTRVGNKFETGELFLPQLLLSAEAAKNAFSAIDAHLSNNGVANDKKGRIILATVYGDIHDIGKNIVKALLNSYGFEVIDLGKDVPISVITETAVKENIKLVGLSALMTTTVVSMEQTIKELRKVSDCKIMVGGAVLTKEYSQKIGADFYGKDALQSVKYAEELFNK